MEFKNEPLTDFSAPAAQAEMAAALRHVLSQFDHSYPNIIDGKWMRSRATAKSINPSHQRQTVGVVPEATPDMAERALAAAVKRFAGWSRVPVEQRAELLLRMAEKLRQRKMEFCAWIIYEVGKNWSEADADVAEAIDFLEYYARLASQPAPALNAVPDERNLYRYLPLGPTIVIPPWNFPLAILVGMTAAALVTGNTVVLKPSGLSPVIAAKFAELAEEAGVPAGVLNLITGSGAVIGELLVRDPRTRMIAFTGSREVGLRINALAAQTPKDQRWIKRVIAEMGGKNAIIVDDSADLDAAVEGVSASAFGYQGQKCSACSRAFVHRALYDAFVERLREKVAAIRQGPAEVRENFMGPVSSSGAQRKILASIAQGKRSGRLLSGGGTVLKQEGFYVQPTVFERLPATSRLWQEEIFGPVLAVAPVRDFEEGLRRANDTAFGLTGAVFSRTPEHLERAREAFFCGNLYLNRKCTGALVGGHPFGGFNMSGTDSKAGGPDYLLLFTQAQAIAERTAG